MPPPPVWRRDNIAGKIQNSAAHKQSSSPPVYKHHICRNHPRFEYHIKVRVASVQDNICRRRNQLQVMTLLTEDLEILLPVPLLEAASGSCAHRLMSFSNFTGTTRIEERLGRLGAGLIKRTSKSDSLLASAFTLQGMEGGWLEAAVSAGLHLDHHEQEHFLKGLHHHHDQQEHLLGRPKGFESHSGCPQECRRLRKAVPWPESVVLAERNELGLLGIASLIITYSANQRI